MNRHDMLVAPGTNHRNMYKQFLKLVIWIVGMPNNLSGPHEANLSFPMGNLKSLVEIKNKLS